MYLSPHRRRIGASGTDAAVDFGVGVGVELRTMNAMMGAANPAELLQHLMQADEFGVKLEVVMGSYTWEFFPSPLHQGVNQQIYNSVRPGKHAAEGGCGCHRFMDTYVRFPDGSLKRPDLAIYCTAPLLTREAITLLPEAVVEVMSPGGELKDLEIGPAFYLSQGVKDVIVVNPELGSVHHFRADGPKRYDSPVTISLECGYELDA